MWTNPSADDPTRTRTAYIAGYKMSVWRPYDGGWSWGAWNAFDVVPAYYGSASWHQAKRNAAIWAKANASSGLSAPNGALYPRTVRAIQFGRTRSFLTDYGQSGLSILPPESALRPSK
jgi:hypothetical protein